MPPIDTQPAPPGEGKQMSIEQALAAKLIAKMLREGWGKQAAIAAAAKHVRSQGFGAEHSDRVAREMFDLVA